MLSRIGIGLLILAIVIAIGLVLVLGPVWTIYALNTLFGLGIAVNIKTWLAAFWLMLVVSAMRSSYSSKK